MHFHFISFQKLAVCVCVCVLTSVGTNHNRYTWKPVRHILMNSAWSRTNN